MSSLLYKEVNYKAPIDYMISTYIREYDISKANINILLYKEAITLEEYNYFYNLEKVDRQVSVGIMLKRNPDLVPILRDGLIEIKKYFFETNDIQDHEVLSIKNDAIFLINKIPLTTGFNGVDFINRNIYTSYYKLHNTELYYLYDPVMNSEKLDVKGIRPENIKLHENYFLEFLLTAFCAAQTESIDNVINLVQTFSDQYTKRELDVNYYRRFDPASLYVLIKNFSEFSNFKAMNLTNKEKNMVDISYNGDIIRDLYKIYSNIFFSNKK